MKSKLIALLLTLMAFGLTGCGDSTGDINQISGQQGNAGPQPTPTPTPGDANVRVARLALDYPGLDIIVNGTEAEADTEAGDISNYFEVPAGQTRVQVRAAGSETDLLDRTITVAPGSHNTFAITGAPSETSEQVRAQVIPGLRLVALVDDVTPNIAGISVRFVNAIPYEQGANARIETPETTVLAGPQLVDTASPYVNFTQALAFDWIVLQLPEAEETWVYETEAGTNEPIFDAIRDALGGQPANLTIFVTGDGSELPAYVVIDDASAGGETYAFLGRKLAED